MRKGARRTREHLASTVAGGVFGVVLAYAFLSRAFSTGSYLQYFATILFFVLGVRLLVRSFKNYHGSKSN